MTLPVSTLQALGPPKVPQNAVGFTNVARADRERARLTHIFELIFEDSQRNVYRGELEVRPPGAPTTAGRSGKGVLVRARSKEQMS